MAEQISVVGIGADGWDGLAPPARARIVEADVVFGSTRQIATVSDHARHSVPWPSPLVPQLRSLIDGFDGSRICVLASGDPMFHGIGVTLVREFGAARLDVFPAPSSVSLACARLGWPLHATATVSLVDSPVEIVLPDLANGRRLLILSRGSATPGILAELLTRNGFGRSSLTVLQQLGGPAERSLHTLAGDWRDEDVDPLNVVALEVVADPDARRHTRGPGLPDDSFTGDGQLTKREVRALTLSALAPSPGEMLWDVGGGSGTISIEWMRTERTCRAIAFEVSALRRQQIVENASRLGVPGLKVLGAAPEAFPDTTSGATSDAAPDAVFVGGGATQPGMIDACWEALASGGRIVVNSVTAESDSLLLQLYGERGGLLRKFQIYRGESLGTFTTWRPQLPVTQWTATKP